MKMSAGQNRRAVQGFSLVEMMITIAIIIILACIAVMGMMPLVSAQHVINAYDTTLSVMRQARDCAVGQRTAYSVTFSNSATPNTIAVAAVAPSSGTANLTGISCAATYQLPTDVQFLTQTGFPNTAATAPDSYFNSSLYAIDMGFAADGYTTGVTTGSQTVYFCPDGSAQTNQDGTGNCYGSWEGGVVYLGQSGNLLSSRAITLWGGTGRIHGWRLYPKTGGGYQWVRQ